MNRKYIFIIVLLIGYLLSGCMVHVNEPEYKPVHGSGELVNYSMTLPQFHSIEFNTAGKILILSGVEQEVSVTVNENLDEYLDINVKNGKLIVGIKDHYQVNDLDLTINITMTELELLTANSAGSIFGENRFSSESVTLFLNSAGSINLELEADRLFSYLNSAGSLNLNGEVREHRTVISSAGSLNALGLMTKNTIAILSSAGNGYVNVTDILDATLASIGSLYYIGEPEVTGSVSSIGRIYNSN